MRELFHKPTLSLFIYFWSGMGACMNCFTNRTVVAPCDDELMLVDELQGGDGLHMRVEHIQHSWGFQGHSRVRFFRWVALVVFLTSSKPFACL